MAKPESIDAMRKDEDMYAQYYRLARTAFIQGEAFPSFEEWKFLQKEKDK